MANADNFVMNQSEQLRTIADAYGEEGAKGWMKVHLLPVFGLVNAEGDNNSMLLMTEMVNILYEKFRYERCSVFILFCAKCRAHDYKISYGTIRIDAVLDAANTFLRQDLPRLKEKVGIYKQQNGNGTKDDYREYESWKYTTSRGIWEAWYNATARLIKEKGDMALVKSIETDDEYHCGICAMLGIGALTEYNGHALLIRSKFEEHVGQLR